MIWVNCEVKFWRENKTRASLFSPPALMKNRLSFKKIAAQPARGLQRMDKTRLQRIGFSEAPRGWAGANRALECTNWQT
jgi:hypothetical protein